MTKEAAIESWNTRTSEIVRCGECVYWEPGDMDAIKILEKSKEVENASTD